MLCALFVLVRPRKDNLQKYEEEQINRPYTSFQ